MIAPAVTFEETSVRMYGVTVPQARRAAAERIRDVLWDAGFGWVDVAVEDVEA